MINYELKEKHKKQISKSIDNLNKTLEEIRKDVPEANYYIEDSGNFNVISGDSHDDDGKPLFDRVLMSEQLDNASGGGW